MGKDNDCSRTRSCGTVTKLPDYNPDGKKYTFEQHMKLKREKEEREAELLEQNKGEKPGRCPKCDQSSFFLRCEAGVLIRTCKNPNCLDENYF
jgi:hypothetical protein